MSRTVHLTEDEKYQIVDGYIKTEKLDMLRSQIYQVLKELDIELKSISDDK